MRDTPAAVLPIRMVLEPGAQLTPNLRLVRKLGAGGMGTVWIARHEGLAADVVVKFMSEHAASVPESIARFRREAAAAAQVKSRHVVQMLDHGVANNGLPYIAMELLEGEDLATRLQREKRLDPQDVVAVISQVARALQRAHEKGIVHRDIKPENIFLCDTGEGEAFVKVLDFGIAKFTGDSGDASNATATGTMIGTVAYMSPEQVVGDKAIDHHSDLWSLGVVAFVALTGVRPFAGETQGAVLLKICTGALPLPSSYRAELPRAVDEWFATACARETSLRFSSARALAKALEDAVGRVGTIAETGSHRAPVSAFEPTLPIDSAEARAAIVSGSTTAATSRPSELVTTAPPTKNRGLLIAALAAAALAGTAFVATRRPRSEPIATEAKAAAIVAPPPLTSAASVASATPTITATVAPSITAPPPSVSAPAKTPVAKPVNKPAMKPVPAPGKPADEVIE